MTVAIEAREVFHVYESPEGNTAALQGLTLAIEEGQITAILGPSGSGKSTLLRMLAGLERPSAGSLHVFGARPRGAEPAAAAPTTARACSATSSSTTGARSTRTSARASWSRCSRRSRARRGGSAWRGQTSCSSASGSATAATRGRGSSRAASSSASPSAPPSRTGRSCC